MLSKFLQQEFFKHKLPILIGLFLEEDGICLNLASSGYFKSSFGDFCRSIQGLLEHLWYHLQPRMACYHLRNQ